MKRPALGFHVVTFLIGVAALFFCGAASADPPSRVARLGYTEGTVSFSPAGENDWVEATVNRPLTQGDRLWVDGLARAEVELGGTMIRLNADTSLSVLNLDDRITQLQLIQGTLSLRVRRLAVDQLIEVHTPNLVLTLHQAGDYRIAVDPDSAATDVIVRAGQAEVLGQGAAYTVDARQAYRFDGPDLRSHDYLDAPPLDEFDQWALSRDRVFANSPSARYVSPDVIGYQDLDANGTWVDDVSYGPVWTPNRVAVGWAPYRDGHWAWINPWGWTWVDDAPWGFAVSHYGRWAHLRRGWAWVPGPLRGPAYYAPALVVFVGGDHFRLQLSSGPVGGVAWFPLAPREVYRPAFPVSRSYFERVNRSNTVVDVNVINRSYDSHRSRNSDDLRHEDYRNRRVAGAVIAVPTNTFVQSQPVSRAAVRLPPTTLASAPLALVPSVAPTERSVRGTGGPGEKPPVRGFERSPGRRTAAPQVVPNPGPWPRPVMRPPESRRWPQPLDNDRRGAPPGPRPVPPPSPTANAPASAAPMPAPRQRAPEQKLAAPTMAQPLPVLPVPAHQPAPPNPAPRAVQPAVAAPPALQAALVAAHRPQSPPHQAQADPAAQPRGPRPRPGARKLRDGEDDANQPKRGAEDRQQRR